MTLTPFYGLYGEESFCLANHCLNFLETDLSLEAVSKITRYVVLGIPDMVIFQNQISTRYLQKLQSALHQYDIDIQAAESCSTALKRTLDFYHQAQNLPLVGILIWNDAGNELSLTVFFNNTKIFFHIEKIQTDKQNMVSVLGRFLNYFHLQFSDKKLGKFYFIDNMHTFNRLVALGLSLYNDKNKKIVANLLPPETSNDYSISSYFSEKMRTLKMLKFNFDQNWHRWILFLCGLVTVSWILLCGFNDIQKKREHHLEKQVRHLKPKTELIEKTKTQTAQLKTVLSQLNPHTEPQHLSVSVLTQLSNAMPIGVFLTAIHFDHAHIDITGYAQTQLQIESLVEHLKKNSDFLVVELKPVVPDETYPPYRFNFIVSITIKEGA